MAKSDLNMLALNNEDRCEYTSVKRSREVKKPASSKPKGDMNLQV